MFQPRRGFGGTGFRKYNNKKCVIDGIKFDSLAEGKRYNELKQLRAIGDICDLKVHPRWEFVVGGVRIGRYTADFQYRDRKLETHVEDVKGVKSRDLALRLNLMKALHGIEVKLITKGRK